MTPKEQRNERLAERMIKNLKRRNMEAFYCPTAEEAVKKVSGLLQPMCICRVPTLSARMVSS